MIKEMVVLQVIPYAHDFKLVTKNLCGKHHVVNSYDLMYIIEDTFTQSLYICIYKNTRPNKKSATGHNVFCFGFL
jgi:hypothetical protein